MDLQLDYNEMSFLRKLVRESDISLARSVDEPDDNEPCISENQIVARLSRKFEDLENDAREALGLSRIPTSRDRQRSKQVLNRLAGR